MAHDEPMESTCLQGWPGEAARRGWQAHTTCGWGLEAENARGKHALVAMATGISVKMAAAEIAEWVNNTAVERIHRMDAEV